MAQKTEFQIQKSIVKQTAKVTYFCEAENISPNLAVHQIRRLFKRLRAWLRFYTNDNNELIFSEYHSSPSLAEEKQASYHFNWAERRQARVVVDRQPKGRSGT